MQEQGITRRPQVGLVVAVLAVVLVLGGLGMFQFFGSRDRAIVSDVALHDLAIPPIDADQPVEVETATFALG
jgi:hypothetical protein